MPGQPGHLYRWDLQEGGGGEDAACPHHAHTKKREVQWKTTYCRTEYSMYVIIRNVFKTTLYDVYRSYFKLAFNITGIFRINVTPPPPVNPNGKGSLVAQASAVVIVRL